MNESKTLNRSFTIILAVHQPYSIGYICIHNGSWPANRVNAWDFLPHFLLRSYRSSYPHWVHWSSKDELENGRISKRTQQVGHRERSTLPWRPSFKPWSNENASHRNLTCVDLWWQQSNGGTSRHKFCTFASLTFLTWYVSYDSPLKRCLKDTLCNGIVFQETFSDVSPRSNFHKDCMRLLFP